MENQVKVTEELIAQYLATVAKLYGELEEESPVDTADFISGLNKSIYVLAMRIARRNYEDIFPKINMKEVSVS